MKTTTENQPALPVAPERVGIKKILVPVDFSECSRKALRYGLVLARQFNASVVLLHVVQMNYAGAEFAPVDFPLIEKQMKDSCEEQLKLLEEREIKGAVPSERAVKSGHVATEIAQTAWKTGADLIVISTHGYTGLKHVLLGSTSENVVRHAPCPVLVVREHEHEFISS